jgi:tRNA modification GTPase
VVEFHCHGGVAVLRAVLAECQIQGARLARAGEFSLRAFLNGKLDLTQAEAIAESIAAPTRAALHLAQMKLSGALSRRIAVLREALETLRAQLCLAVDFPDEDVECLPRSALAEEALRCAGEVADLLASAKRAQAWREGVLAVLVGPVNAGKSSLLNALVGRGRAIVSETPGTTRDYLEEPLDLDGLVVRLVDTAGLREAAEGVGAVEAQGQELSRDFMARAEAVLYVIDASRPLPEAERAVLSTLAPARALVVLNKVDLPRAEPELTAQLAALGLSLAAVSARTGEGLEALAGLLRERLLAGQGEPDPDEVAPNARQAATLQRAQAELIALAADAEAQLPYDILGVRLESSCRLMAEITGEIAPQEVLDSIFSRFCIGK